MPQNVWVPKKTQRADADKDMPADAPDECRPVRRVGFGGAAGALLRAAGALQPAQRQRRRDIPTPLRAEPPGLPSPPGLTLPSTGVGDGAKDAAVPTPPVAKVDSEDAKDTFALDDCWAPAFNKTVGYFSMDGHVDEDSDAEQASSEEGDGDDIEDMFGFDPAKMAALLQGDTGEAEPTEHREAVEVPDTAGLLDTAADPCDEQLETNAQLIREAMDIARQRHTQSIPQGADCHDAAVVQDRIEQAMTASYMRRCSESVPQWPQVPPGEWEWPVHAEAQGWYEGACHAEQSAEADPYAYAQADPYAEARAAWLGEGAQAEADPYASWDKAALQSSPWEGFAHGQDQEEGPMVRSSKAWCLSAPSGDASMRMPFAWRCGSA